MKVKLVLVSIIASSIYLTACSKNEAPASHEGQAVPAEEKISPEQQAAIDALDKPEIDTHSTSASSEPTEQK